MGFECIRNHIECENKKREEIFENFIFLFISRESKLKYNCPIKDNEVILDVKIRSIIYSPNKNKNYLNPSNI